MHKLKLNLDDLAVESFATTPDARGAGGTVFGQNHCTCYTQCTCPGCPTCDPSCNGTCGDTCEGTCDYTCGGHTCLGGVQTCADSCDGVCNTYFCV